MAAGSGVEPQLHQPLMSSGKDNPVVTGPLAAPTGAGWQQPLSEPVTAFAVLHREGDLPATGISQLRDVCSREQDGETVQGLCHHPANPP